MAFSRQKGAVTLATFQCIDFIADLSASRTLTSSSLGGGRPSCPLATSLTSRRPNQSLIDEQCKQVDDEESPLELHQGNSIDDHIGIDKSAQESLPYAIEVCLRKPT